MRIPFLNNDRLVKIAAEFLDGHHHGDIPVPIENIVDTKLMLNIVPIDDLRKYHEVDAYLSKDLTAIYVDRREYDYNSNRFRFSLAHEVAHKILHSDFINNQTYDAVDGWKAAIQSLSDKEYSRLEFQANTVGGLIVVPPAMLEREFRKIEDRLRGDLSKQEQLIAAARILAPRFQVSAEVLERRLDWDELIVT